MNKNEWVEFFIEKGCDADVVNFIADVLYKGGNESEAIADLFGNGYCYYFACMLQDAFRRGTVCWLLNHSHIVWVDTDGTAWDVNGVYDDYGEGELVPISDMLEDDLDLFRHVPSVDKALQEKDRVRTLDEIYWYKIYRHDTTNLDFYGCLLKEAGPFVVYTKKGFYTGYVAQTIQGIEPQFSEDLMLAEVFSSRGFADNFIVDNYEWFRKLGTKNVKIMKLKDVSDEREKNANLKTMNLQI